MLANVREVDVSDEVEENRVDLEHDTAPIGPCSSRTSSHEGSDAPHPIAVTRREA
jgi:hypothetical protein